MSMEQQRHQHPLDKRLQVVIDEYNHFPPEISPHDQIFKDILELRATLLRSYNEDDYGTNIKELDAKTAALYSEIDSTQSVTTDIAGLITSPDPAYLERQARISALRIAIEEDKEAVKN